MPALRPAHCAVGVSDHAGWAVLVTVARDLRVLDRRRVELKDPELPALPHHHEGSWAIGRYRDSPWARAVTLDEAVALIEAVRASADRCAALRLDEVEAGLVDRVHAIALRTCPPLPPTIEERIRDNRAQTVADGVMFREALAGAARARGWAVRWIEADALDPGRPEVQDLLRGWGKALGPPWQSDHKRAALAALGALEEDEPRR